MKTASIEWCAHSRLPRRKVSVVVGIILSCVRAELHCASARTALPVEMALVCYYTTIVTGAL
jgi:hypothetical protein